MLNSNKMRMQAGDLEKTKGKLTFINPDVVVDSRKEESDG